MYISALDGTKCRSGQERLPEHKVQAAAQRNWRHYGKEQIVKTDKRRYRRYAVSGNVQFRTEVDAAVGELVHIGRRGMLIRSHFIPPLRTNLSIRFTVHGYGETLSIGGRVVGSEKDMIAVSFSVEPAGMEQLLQWLDKKGKSKVASVGAP